MPTAPPPPSSLGTSGVAVTCEPLHSYLGQADLHVQSLQRRDNAPRLSSQCSLRHHEEGVDEHVEAQGGENVAGVRVVPHADLERNYHGRVEQQRRADEEHHCGKEGKVRRDCGLNCI